MIMIMMGESIHQKWVKQDITGHLSLRMRWPSDKAGWVVDLGFNIPPTAKVIWRLDFGL